MKFDQILADRELGDYSSSDPFMKVIEAFSEQEPEAWLLYQLKNERSRMVLNMKFKMEADKQAKQNELEQDTHTVEMCNKFMSLIGE